MEDTPSEKGWSIQNLKDVGFDRKTADQFIQLWGQGEIHVCTGILSNQRSRLLVSIHETQRMLDILDYLIFKLKFEKER